MNKNTVMPKMLLGTELKDKMMILPDFNPKDISMLSPEERLMRLQDLYRLYIPSTMSIEIYSKLYMALLHSLQKKRSSSAIKQTNENFRAIRQMPSNGIIGGADSFTIIGDSGIGKSSAIRRCTDIITEQIQVKEIVPFLLVQCPFDSSPKNLLLEMLRTIDEALDSEYYMCATRERATTDMLIGSVSQIALNSIGVLIIDEIQNVIRSKNGRILISLLTQLINNSGISICMVGTPECTSFFEQEMQLARRSLGLSYGPMEYNDTFRGICRNILRYQYTLSKIEPSEELFSWLFEHTNGNISILLLLIHDAQELSILSGTDALCIPKLEQAYQQRLSFLHDFIRPKFISARTYKPKQKDKTFKKTGSLLPDHSVSLNCLVEQSKRLKTDLVDILKNQITIDEVKV